MYVGITIKICVTGEAIIFQSIHIIVEMEKEWVFKFQQVVIFCAAGILELLLIYIIN